MLKQIQEALRQADFDAILITSPQNRRYVTGFPSSAGVCVVTEKSGYLFTGFPLYRSGKKARPRGHSGGYGAPVLCGDGQCGVPARWRQDNCI